MVISKAESQRNYYQRKLAENRDDFLKKRKEIKARYYKKTFKNEILEDEVKEKEEIKEFIILKPLKEKLNPLNKSVLKEQTKITYFKSLNTIYNKYNNNDINGLLKDEIFKLLSNEKYKNKLINEELNFIKINIYDIIKSSTNADIRNLYSLLTRIRGFANTIKQLYPYIHENQTNYNNKRINKKTDINVKNKMSKLSFKKEDIIAILNDNDLNLTNKEKLIFSLFTLFPTRRAVDYNRMLISINEKPKTEKKIKLEKRNNYYYNGEFFFNITKNKDIQHYTISYELKEIIENEILSRSNDCDNHLLLNENNKPYTSSKLSFQIMKVYKKIYGIAISAVEIRRLYSTYLKDQVINGNITEQQHKIIAEMMNHSYDENKKYAY